MRIRIDQSLRPGGNTVITPVDPPPTISISSLFVLEEFRASATSVPPFGPMAINWKITAINQTINIRDYQFRLVVFQHVTLNSIEPQGSAPFTLLTNTRAVISGRRLGSGGPWSTFDQAITISLDESKCEIIEHYGTFLDVGIFDELNRVISNIDELRLRRETVPVDPADPDGPKKLVVLQPTSDWTISRIRYNFPLEIELNNFFNADLDIQLDLRFKVEHEANGSNVDIIAEFKSNASFDTGEHILSFVIPFSGASTLAIQKTLNALLPIVFDCRKTEIEVEIGRLLIDNRVRAALNSVRDGRIFGIRIVPDPGDRNNLINVIVCPGTFQSGGGRPGGGGSGGVVVPT